MQQIIDKETVDAIVEGTKSIANVASGVSTELMNEAINLFIFESVLSVLKFSAVFIVFYIVKKYFDLLIETSKENSNGFKGAKTATLIASIVFFTASSFPHIMSIGKALVAPKIFLAEKAYQLKGK